MLALRPECTVGKVTQLEVSQMAHQRTGRDLYGLLESSKLIGAHHC